MGTDKEEVLGKGIFESILEQMNANIFIMDAQRNDAEVLLLQAG